MRESAVLGYTLARHTDEPFLLHIAYLCWCCHISTACICTRCPVKLGQAVYSHSCRSSQGFSGTGSFTLSLHHFAEAVILFARARAGKCFPLHSFIYVHIAGNTIFTNAQSQTFKHNREYVASLNNVEYTS